MHILFIFLALLTIIIIVLSISPHKSIKVDIFLFLCSWNHSAFTPPTVNYSCSTSVHCRVLFSSRKDKREKQTTKKDNRAKFHITRLNANIPKFTMLEHYCFLTVNMPSTDLKLFKCWFSKLNFFKSMAFSLLKLGSSRI